MFEVTTIYGSALVESPPTRFPGGFPLRHDGSIDELSPKATACCSMDEVALS